MSVKNIWKILSTGELCVDEGDTVTFVSGIQNITKHVSILDPQTYLPTEIYRDVEANDLETFMYWNGSRYVPVESNH